MARTPAALANASTAPLVQAGSVSAGRSPAPSAAERATSAHAGAVRLKPGHHLVDIRRDPRRRGPPRGHRVNQQLAHSSMPSPVFADVIRIWTSSRSSESSSLRRSCTQSSIWPAPQEVSLVEHHGDHLGMSGEWYEKASVHCGVGVFLRIEYPDHEVGPADKLVHDISGVAHGRSRGQGDPAVRGQPGTARRDRARWTARTGTCAAR